MRQRGISWPTRLFIWLTMVSAAWSFVIADDKVSTATLLEVGWVGLCLIRLAHKGRNADYVVMTISLGAMFWLQFWLLASCVGVWLGLVLLIMLWRFRAMFERIDGLIGATFRRSKLGRDKGFVTVVATKVAPDVNAIEVLEKMGFREANAHE